jgi:hypothetical protein
MEAKLLSQKKGKTLHKSFKVRTSMPTEDTLHDSEPLIGLNMLVQGHKIPHLSRPNGRKSAASGRSEGSGSVHGSIELERGVRLEHERKDRVTIELAQPSVLAETTVERLDDDMVRVDTPMKMLGEEVVRLPLSSLETDSTKRMREIDTRRPQFS